MFKFIYIKYLFSFFFVNLGFIGSTPSIPLNFESVIFFDNFWKLGKLVSILVY